MKISKRMLFGLCCLGLLLLAGCGEGTQDQTQGTVNNRTQVAGAGQERIYAYIREINPQARTITVDQVEVVSRYNQDRLKQIGEKANLTAMDDWYLYNANTMRQMYALDTAAVFDLTGATVYSQLGYDSNMLSNDTGSVSESVTPENQKAALEGSGLETASEMEKENGYTDSTEQNRYSEDGRLLTNNETTNDSLNNNVTNNNMTNNNVMNNNAMNDTLNNNTTDNNMLNDGMTNNSTVKGAWVDSDFQSAVDSISNHLDGDEDHLYLLTLEKDKVVGITRVTSAAAAL